MNENSKRINYLDYAKAITIYLVVLGHTPLRPDWLTQWIYCFHMPVFFSFYGFSWKQENVNKIKSKDFWRKKIERLLLPALLWALIYSKLSIKNFIYILYGSQASFRKAGSLTSIWFLPCMFLAVLLFELTEYLLSLIKKRSLRYIIEGFVFLTYSVISFLICEFFMVKIGFPWSVNLCFFAAFFMYIGKIFKFGIDYFLSIKKSYRFLIQFFCLVISFLIITLTYKLNLTGLSTNNIDMSSGNVGNYFYFILDSISGLIFVFMFALLLDLLPKNKPLLYIGQNTMGVFLIHKPIVQSMSRIIGNRIDGYELVLSILITIFALFISLLFTWIINKNIPVLFGKVKVREC